MKIKKSIIFLLCVALPCCTPEEIKQNPDPQIERNTEAEAGKDPAELVEITISASAEQSTKAAAGAGSVVDWSDQSTKAAAGAGSVVDWSDQSTKAAIGTGNTVNWAEGDCISLLSGDKNFCFTLEEGAGTNEGTFTGTVTAAVAENLAGSVVVYPYSEHNSLVIPSIGEPVLPDSEEGGSTTGGTKASGQNSTDQDVTEYILTIDWNGCYVQTAVKDSFDPTSCLMAGTVDADGNASFKNVISYIKFSMDFACQSITITDLAADSSVDFQFNSDGLPIVQSDMMDWSNSKTVTLVAGGEGSGVAGSGEGESTKAGSGMGAEDGTKAGTSIIASGTYLVAVLPQVISNGFTISFTDDAGNVYTKTTLKSATLTRGHILNIGSFSKSTLTPEGEFDGEGTEASPYLITSFEKLKLLERVFSNRSTAGNYKKKHFKQTVDIDCGGQQVHIGHYIVDRAFAGSDLDAPFDGTYDGNGKKITNYWLGSVQMRDGVYACGLFPYIKDATIKNLTVSPYAQTSGVLLRAQEEDCEYVIGCLVGLGTAGYINTSGTTISNCHVLAGDYNIYGRASTTSLIDGYQALTYGGIVGRSPQKIDISDCSSAANVYLYYGFSQAMGSDIEAIAGGIVGKIHNAGGENYVSKADIKNCRNTGRVYVDTKADNAFSGGIVGYVYDQGWGNAYVHILNCVNSGNVSAYNEDDETYAGGIIGYNNSDGYTEDFSSRNPWVYNCLNTGMIEATNGKSCSAAGIIGAGYDSDTEVIYCVNTGPIYAQSLTSTAVKAAISGKATSTWTSISAYCIGCYWISDKDENGKPVFPIIGKSNPEISKEYKNGDYFDSYCYQTVAESGTGPLTPYVVNNRIYQGWDALDSPHKCSEWTTAEWLANAAKWVWNDGHLDLDFTQRISM